MTSGFFGGGGSALDGSDRPSALLYFSVILAQGAIRAIGDRGLTPGRDNSVNTHDDVFPYLKRALISAPFLIHEHAGLAALKIISGPVRGLPRQRHAFTKDLRSDRCWRWPSPDLAGFYLDCAGLATGQIRFNYGR